VREGPLRFVFFSSLSDGQRILIALMFPINLSYVAILREVVVRCNLPYVACIHEIADDGSHVYGIEVELTPSVQRGISKTLFFWAPVSVTNHLPYEAAALQALIGLQRIYGFLVIDYSIHGLQLYRSLAERLFPVANRGAHLARLVLASLEEDTIPSSVVLMYAQQLLDQVSSSTESLAL